MEKSEKNAIMDSELFCNHLLSRDSTPVGRSSRAYYRARGQVPFEWELEPGQPKKLPAERMLIPPLSPPPAMQSARLAQCCGHEAASTTPSSATAKSRRSKRQWRAPECKCIPSNGYSTSAAPSPGCFDKLLKLPAFGSARRWYFSRTLVGIFGGT